MTAPSPHKFGGYEDGDGKIPWGLTDTMSKFPSASLKGKCVNSTSTEDDTSTSTTNQKIHTDVRTTLR